MDVKKINLFLNISLLGLCIQSSSFAADGERFVETVAKKTESGVLSNVRQLCLKDQGLKIEDDVVAVINKASGKVMADKGKGFVTSPVGTFLKEGDRVVALEESGAEVVFFDCCSANLKSNNLINIKTNPGCKAAIVDAAPATQAVAGTHPASWIPPVTGGILFIRAISEF